MKPPEAFAVGHYIRGPVEVEGEARPGRVLDLVFPEPLIHSVDGCDAPLRIASVDIETNVEDGAILAAGICATAGGTAGAEAGDCGLARVLSRQRCGDAPPDGKVYFHPTEASLLEAFLGDIRKLDPDVITGWNFLDFDFPMLAKRCAFHRIPFRLGRSAEEAKYFPPSREEAGGGEAETGRYSRPRSAAALVPGRQVLDALRIYRSGPRGFAGGGGRDNMSYTLEAVARSVLGEGKLAASASAGSAKIEELNKLYRADPIRFGEYCLHDAALVMRILEKTGLFRLTVERAGLTGVSLDKAWTSVVSFERAYGMELRRRGIAPVPANPGRSVSGAAGGTVLEPLPGLFNNVAVFDFRSLYPTVMLTFNIDPRAHALAHARSGAGESPITAPNGAAFSRRKGILPELIAGYFAARRRAMDAGDEEASFVYKILMNSFYGVLGTPSCRYGRTELAGAITSFARKWLLFSRDWFTRNGYRVLYGDTDSLFVETGLGDTAGYRGFLEWGKSRARELNQALAEKVREEYALESHMELRFEKPYRRFMIPPLRNIAGEGRGRAKGYGGYLLDKEGGVSVEVKGMEAVRSDYTPLARRVQMELLELVFSGGNESEFNNRVNRILAEMRLGNLDGELIYRKRLSRNPETYTASTPPQVKAARALGWKNRRGIVEYVWTTSGPEPAADETNKRLPRGPLDYDHYAESQVLPAARSIAAAAGWNAEVFHSPGKKYFRDGQMELGL
jgi:DNA polymerase-2